MKEYEVLLSWLCCNSQVCLEFIATFPIITDSPVNYFLAYLCSAASVVSGPLLPPNLSMFQSNT